jgi:hypothetical protein
LSNVAEMFERPHLQSVMKRKCSRPLAGIAISMCGMAVTQAPLD